VLRILVGNKCDLDIKRQVSTEQGMEMGISIYFYLFFNKSEKIWNFVF